MTIKIHNFGIGIYPALAVGRAGCSQKQNKSATGQAKLLDIRLSSVEALNQRFRYF